MLQQQGAQVRFQPVEADMNDGGHNMSSARVKKFIIDEARECFGH